MHLLQRFGLSLTLCCLAAGAWAQPKLEFNLKKPKQFQERKLGSEKNLDKKFGFPRRVFQNTITRFNYYFNANLKLNEIVDEARRQNKDDYTKLLPFYTYSFDNTAKNTFIDSILQKCTAGILLHDLRNDWIDNLYLIMGKAYLLRKDYDSAAMTFQFLNYSYAPKEKDGYDLPIGSNATDGGSAFSVSTKEKKGPTAYLLGEPPSRNDAFLWQVRALTESGNYIDASSLIEVLSADPKFPARLKEELHEAKAYVNYKTGSWDSSATHLLKALPLAYNQDEKARWYFLAGQMFQLANQPKAASDAFAKCSDAALDPVLDIYARLNSIRLRKSDNPKIIDENIATLEAMAKKDKYVNYRDIIYYAAALFELERDGFAAAESFLKKSLTYPQNTPAQRSLSFLLLGDLAFNQKKYGAASNPYDSTVTTLLSPEDVKRVEGRSPGCHKILEAENTIALGDSLLKIANMPEAERVALVKKYSKALRKARGLKEDMDAAATGTGGTGSTSGAGASGSADLFTSGGTKWYFTDLPQRTAGFQKFKDRWGARPNTDDWRRSATQRSAFANANASPLKSSATPSIVEPNAAQTLEADTYDTTDVSFDNLYSRLPLDSIKQRKVNNNINTALFAKAEALHNDIEDYPEAIKIYELLLSRLDTGMLAQQSLYALVHCYTKTGNLTAANDAQLKLQKNFGANPIKEKSELNNKNKTAGTNTYKQIYNLFLEGKFAEAVAQKTIADSTYGTYFWTPQLLYIESIFHIKSRQDSAAISSLTNIEAKFADHPLAKRAATLKDVLGRRAEIETYLTELKVTRASEDDVTVFGEKPLDNRPQRSDSTLESNLRLKADRQRQLDSSVAAQQAAFTAMEAKRKMDSTQLANGAQERKKDSLTQAKQLLKALADRRQDSLAQLNQQKLAADARAKDSLAQVKQKKLIADGRAKDSLAQLNQQKLAATARLKDSLAQVRQQKLVADTRLKDSLAQVQLQKLAAAEKRKDSLAQAKLAAQLREQQAKDSATRVANRQKEAATKLKDSLYQDDLRKRQLAAALKKDKALEAALAKEAEEAKAKEAANAANRAKQLAAERRADSLQRVQLAKQQQDARTKDSVNQDQIQKQARAASTKDSLAQVKLAQQVQATRAKDSLAQAKLAQQAQLNRIKDSLNQARIEKQALEARAKDSIAQAKLAQQAQSNRTKDSLNQVNMARQQAEASRIKDSLNQANLARQEAAKRTADSLKLVADYKKTDPKSPAVFVVNNIASPFLIEPNKPHQVALVLEKIDPAYVNEVAYAFNNNPMRHKGDTLVQAQKIKLSDNLWLVTLQSSKFSTAQDAIDYMDHVKPLAKSNIISWLDETKYQYIIVSPRNLALLKQPEDLTLYRKVLAAVLPGKF
ncbi:MAG: hypothetical protein EAY75_16200 [Bacteroidetes bacterium]|nr:MAG: hypothetical protein EAY75_16200 [Bacteroidota bacterium]